MTIFILGMQLLNPGERNAEGMSFLHYFHPALKQPLVVVRPFENWPL